MTSRSRSIVSTSSRLAVLGLILLGSVDALAAKKVAVFPFEGKGSIDAEDEVASIVQKDSDLVSSSALARAKKRLGVKKLNESAIARLAAELQADAFIEGSLEKGRRGGYTLLLTIYEGKTGAVTDTLAFKLRSPRLDSDSKAELSEKLVPALAKITALSDEEPVVDITPTGPAVPQGDDSEKAPLADKKPPSDVPAPIEGGEETEEGVAKTSELESNRHARWAAADVELGVSAVRRSLSFTYASDLTSSQRPNGYNGSVVPSLIFTGEVYPMAFGKNPGPAGGFGLAVVVDRVLLLKSRLGMKEYATTQMKVGGGLRYRWNFGKKATLPTLKLIAGFNRLSFTIDRGTDDIDLPNVAYSYIDVGAAGRFPLGTPKAAIYVDARYNQVLSAGEVSEMTFYGSGSARGFDGDAGFELQFLGRAILKVGGRYQRIAHDFDGNGTKSNNRDGNASTQDVGGALDTYLSGYVTAGYLF